MSDNEEAFDEEELDQGELFEEEVEDNNDGSKIAHGFAMNSLAAASGFLASIAGAAAYQNYDGFSMPDTATMLSLDFSNGDVSIIVTAVAAILATYGAIRTPLGAVSAAAGFGAGLLYLSPMLA